MDSDDKIKFKEIYLRLTNTQFEEWKEYANNQNQSLEDYIIDSVDGQVLRSQIVKYLDDQSRQKPWWKKKFYTL